MRDVPPAVASLLLLLAGDVETNPGPSCYVCGQNFRQSDTPLTSHTPDYVIRTHKQTRCSGVPRSQQSLSWHCSTHCGPGPPVTTQTAHTCCRCHYPFRPGTRPLACLTQGCMNLAHTVKRCSGPTAPPTSGAAFTTATSPKQLQACQHLPTTPVSSQETKTEAPAEAAAARLLPTSSRSSATTAAKTTTSPAPASPATQPAPLPAQATGRAFGALPLLHLHLPNLL